jgi:predicted metal-binding protein
MLLVLQSRIISNNLTKRSAGAMTEKKAAAIPFVHGATGGKMQEDLGLFRQKALELGAAGAEIIRADQLVVDERVRLKCLIPRCLRAGETPNCPPHAPDLDLVRKAFARYSWGLLIKTHVEPMSDFIPGSNRDKTGIDRSLLFHQKTATIVWEIERLAYKHGYSLAMGLGGGSCKDYLCHGLVCQFKDSGRCRFPLRARPAMEALGIDVVDIIGKAGWSAYPLIDDPAEIPCATSVGLVLIN